MMKLEGLFASKNHIICLRNSFSMKVFSLLFLHIFFVFYSLHVIAQSQIAVGSWRIHVSYLEGGYLTGSNQTVFSQGRSSLFYFSVNDFDPKPLTVMDGLYTQSFNASAFDPVSKKLIVGYRDGTVDLVGEKNVQRLTSIRDNPLILNKNINSAKTLGGFVYLAGDFGVAVIDPQKAAFMASYINIGPNGSSLEILDIDEDSGFYYLATRFGLVIGDKHENLNDFRNWQIQNLNVIGGSKKLAVYEGNVYMIGSDNRVYILEEGILNWMIGTENVSSLKKFGEQLYFSDRSSIYQVGEGGSFLQFYNHGSNEIVDFHMMGDDILISQVGKGVFNVSSNTHIFPNGPSSSAKSFHWDKNGTWALPGGFQFTGATVSSIGSKTSVLKEGIWSEALAPDHVISKSIFRNSDYFGTIESGLWKVSDGSLQQIVLPGTNQKVSISSLVVTEGNLLWVGVFDNFGSLYKISGNGDISQVQVQGLQFPRKIIVDRYGNLWILQTPPTGQNRIRVFNESTGLNRFLGNAVNQGNLPNSEIRDMDLDQEGNLWVGTSSGVFYLPFVQFVNSNSVLNSIFPIFENRQLLSGVAITSVLVAPDQTKWYGTERDGLWHFSELGDERFGHFTGDNNPLTSASIQSLAIDPVSGELLIVQPNAAFSFRTNSMGSFENFSELKIFPNPVRPDFSGYLSIEGLTDFSRIKITTAAGRVVYSTQVRGGKATWNIMEGLGGRPGPGVYLVYVIDASGQERISGKFVVL
ncbi:two-component regulator propeller domain-containing protein [Aquiflexum sp.]|uniref:type IX secretion system anionic LPS delivery protein PorZ n=1 Tax=Aquiflexum sp. TaxID=1872584 RepID=UPI0035934F2B